MVYETTILQQKTGKLQNQNNQQGINRAQSSEGVQKWTKLRLGTVKLNCDAAWTSSTGRGGIKVIAGNHAGEVVAGYQSSEMAVSINFLEARAVYEGVKLTIENSWESVEIESDAEVVINHVKGTTKFWQIESIIQNSIYLAGSIRNLTWNRIPQYANQCVDWLAKHAISGMCHTDWVNQPPLPLREFCR